jgi:DNA-binding NarL/FixJ family response regulator
MRRLHPVHDRSPANPSGSGRIRVALANDHAGLRRSLRSLLEDTDGLELVGEAHDLGGALHALATQHPDVLVLDLRMPDGFSAERIRRLRRLSPGTEIVVTTMNPNETLAQQSLSAGAAGFVLADSADGELVHAVRRAARGLTYTSPRLTRAVG